MPENELLNCKHNIVDSLPPGLLEGRPAGGSLLLTHHQLQQLQQQLQVAAASQQEQVATASAGITLALHHHAGGGGASVLTPQLLLASQTAPSFTAYPVTSSAQHTSIQQVLQHHVRQSSILQHSTIQQIGSQSPVAQQTTPLTELGNGLTSGKCISTANSAFSSRSLTPTPQQRIITTQQPVFQQVMSVSGPVLQIYQPATRSNSVSGHQLKNKAPPQILPKPITNIMTQTTLKSQPTQSANHQANALLLNQMIPGGSVLLGQQTTGLQLYLKSPQHAISTSNGKSNTIVTSDGSLSHSPNTLFVQTNRQQPQQVVQLITGQSLQLQQVQTSSGTTLVALPTFPQCNSTSATAVASSVATMPIQTTVVNNQSINKKTVNNTIHLNSVNGITSSASNNISILNNTNCNNLTNNHNNINDNMNNSNNSNSNNNGATANNNSNVVNNQKKKRRKEDEITKLDLANLMKLSGIEEEDVAPISLASPASSSVCSSLSSMSCPSPVSSASPSSVCNMRTHSPPVTNPVQSHNIDQNNLHQQFISDTCRSQETTPILTQLHTPSTNQQCDLRLSVGEDGHLILHQPQFASQSVTASVATTAQSQLAQLIADHGGHILQTAVLSLTGSESIVLKTPTPGLTLRSPSLMLQRSTATAAPSIVLTSADSNTSNGVRIITDVGSLNGLPGRVQFVSGANQDQNRIQIVTGVPNPSAMSLTEQQRVQIVTGVPDLTGVSLTTEQQNRVQILSSVPSTATGVSLTTEQQQNRMEIISNVPSTTGINDQKTSSRIQVIPTTSRTVSLTEQLVSDISQQILSTVPSSNIRDHSTSHAQMIFPTNSNTASNGDIHISSSESTTNVQITSNLPEPTINQQTTKVQMISLNEQQNRFHLIPNSVTDFTASSSPITSATVVTTSNNLDNKLQNIINQKFVNTTDNIIDNKFVVNNCTNVRLIEQSDRCTQQQHQHEFSNIEQSSIQQPLKSTQLHVNNSEINNDTVVSGRDNQNRIHFITNLDEHNHQPKYIQLSEEQNRIILTSSSIEHQTVINPPVMSFIDQQQQNRLNIVGINTVGNHSNKNYNNENNSSYVDEREQNRLQIIANLKQQEQQVQQQRIIQLNGHQIINNNNRSATPNTQTMSQQQTNDLQFNSKNLHQQNFLEQNSHELHQVQPQQRTIIQQSQPLQKQHDITFTISPNDKVVNHTAINTTENVVNEGFYTNNDALIDTTEEQRKLILNHSNNIINKNNKLLINDDNNSESNSFLNYKSLCNSGVNTYIVNNQTSLNNSLQINHSLPNLNTNNQQNILKIPTFIGSGTCFISSSSISPRSSPQPSRSPQPPSIKSPNNHSSQSTIYGSSHNTYPCFGNRPNLTIVTQSSPVAIQQQQQMLQNNQSFDKNGAVAKVIPQCQTSKSSSPSSISVLSYHSQQENPTNIINVNGCNGDAEINHGENEVISDKFIPNYNNSGNNNHNPSNTITPAPSFSPVSRSESVTCLSSATTNNHHHFQSSSSTSFVDSIIQSHPNISINKSAGNVSPKMNSSKIKKPKKAVVKPMVFQQDEKDRDSSACLAALSSGDGANSGVVQRVQTIQLTSQKQQHLKTIQTQISVLSSKKVRTAAEQMAIQRLFNEQQKILLSGKIIPTVPGQNSNSLTFVSTPVRLVPPPNNISPHPPSTPPTCNKSTSPLHVQVGTQTCLDEPLSPLQQIPLASEPKISLPDPQPIPNVPSPLPQQLSTPSTPPLLHSPPTPERIPSPPKVPTPPPTLTLEERANLIRRQYETDQKWGSEPDIKTSFSSVDDACTRLLRYHVYNEPVFSEKDLEKADEIFESTAKHLLDKYSQMLNKFRGLLFKDSMKQVGTCEKIFMERLYISGEIAAFEKMKNELSPSSNPVMCSIATQVDSADEDENDNENRNIDNCTTGVKIKREHDDDDKDILSSNMPDIKKHCPDDEEINAHVQSAIDSILNLQKGDLATNENVRVDSNMHNFQTSDPVTDEAVRSILQS